MVTGEVKFGEENLRRGFLCGWRIAFQRQGERYVSQVEAGRREVSGGENGTWSDECFGSTVARGVRERSTARGLLR